MTKLAPVRYMSTHETCKSEPIAPLEVTVIIEQENFHPATHEPLWHGKLAGQRGLTVGPSPDIVRQRLVVALRKIADDLDQATL
jgi:hypothetical protein